MPLESSGERVVEGGILYRTPLLANLRTISSFLAEARPRRVLTIGGDCSVELGPLAWLRSVWGDSLTLLWIDAHPDLNTPASSRSGHFHGMPLRHLMGEGDPEVLELLGRPTAAELVILVGARSLDPPEEAWISARRLTHATPALRSPNDAERLAEQLVAAGRTVYLHVDLDVLDPAAFASVCCPEPDGWSPEALTAFCSRLAERAQVAGLGVTEYLPQPSAGLEPLAGFLDLLRVLFPS